MGKEWELGRYNGDLNGIFNPITSNVGYLADVSYIYSSLFHEDFLGINLHFGVDWSFVHGQKILPIAMGKNRDIIEYNGTTNNLADVIYMDWMAYLMEYN